MNKKSSINTAKEAAFVDALCKRLEPIWAITDAIEDETERQFEKWGEQNHKDITQSDLSGYRSDEKLWKKVNASRVEQGKLTWDGILLEEVFEALAAAQDPKKLREELIQVAAVATSWVACIDRREARKKLG